MQFTDIILHKNNFLTTPDLQTLDTRIVAASLIAQLGW